MSILEEIIKNRKDKIKRKGHGLGVKLPRERNLPLVPFGRDPFIICEIKRRSPSKKIIALHVDAVRQAQIYVERGIKSVSVLTEEDYFSGSLNDLLAVKKSFPHLSLLRKDFILDEEDIDVSYWAGADALLLIAKIHDVYTLTRLCKKTKLLGMKVLLEVHDEEDLEKARRLKPDYTGINSRNLKDFHVDTDLAFQLAGRIDWSTRTVFESGILSMEDASRALARGFSGVLVGEGVMRNPSLITKLYSVFVGSWGPFWQKLFSQKKEGKPLTKICGITRREDATLAAERGADVLGFIFADSPRKAPFELPKRLGHLHVLKVGVVTGCGIPLSIDKEVKELLTEGFLDAIQFHGAESPQELDRFSFPCYKAVRMKDESDLELIALYPCPRVLIDTYVPGIPGGTGSRVPEKLVLKAKAIYPLWLAGGIGPLNVREIVEKFQPELIDSSSHLESTPGIKDHHKVKKFFKEVEIAKAL
jgi:indole-3-glycerol phosphate synthase/phosphoribosylanthranilate isomerase